MSDSNSSFFNNSLTDSFVTAKDSDSAFSETSGSSIHSLDSINISETFSQSSSNNCDTAGIDIDKCTSKWKADFGIKTSENANLIEFGGTLEIFNQCSGVMSSDFINIVNNIEIQDNEFHECFKVSNEPFFINSVENSKSSCEGKVDSEPLDSVNNAFKSTNLFKSDCNSEIFNQNPGDMPSDFINIVNDIEIKDEGFSNGFQVFNDPTFLNFFENSKSSSNVEESVMCRSSLYRNFDPLFRKSLTEPNVMSTELRETAKGTDFEFGNLSILYSDNVKERKFDKNQDVKCIEGELIKIENNECNIAAENNVETCIKNKPISNTSLTSKVPSHGNNLISFDLSVINDIGSTDGSCVSKKLYSEEELKHSLKIQEHLLKEKYMRELEEMFSNQQNELYEELRQRKLLSNGFFIVIKETMDIALALSEKESLMKNKLELLENENKELKIDLNKSLEDLTKIEKTFSNLFKSYEECKNLLKTYIENERKLVQQIEIIQVKLFESETTKIIQEQFAKCNTELGMESRTDDNQVEMLKMQIRDAELKISISEKNLKLLKTENEKLNVTCNDLISKVYNI